jgi:hypothetical protein
MSQILLRYIVTTLVALTIALLPVYTQCQELGPLCMLDLIPPITTIAIRAHLLDFTLVMHRRQRFAHRINQHPLQQSASLHTWYPLQTRISAPPLAQRLQAVLLQAVTFA